MRKVYFIPIHLLDLSFVIFKLNEDKLTLERFSAQDQMFSDLKSPFCLDGFEQVTSAEFNLLCQKQATRESVEEFEKYYRELYQ